MAPLLPWLGALLAALPIALAGHGDPIAQKYIVEFADAKTVSSSIQSCEMPFILTNLLSHLPASCQL